MYSKMNKPMLMLMAFAVMACNNKPKVISETSDSKSTTKQSSGIFSEATDKSTDSKLEVDLNDASFKESLHKVIVNEVLPAAKYVYLNVNEGEKQFWIATGKKEVIVGETYFYKGGLLKTNFESKEYNRIFETVYLVTNLVAEKHGNNNEKVNIDDYSKTEQKASEKVAIETHTEKVKQHEGSIKISELVENKEKYAGKTVQLSGICTKINAGIMDRNWIHLKDGSKDDFDLIVTSETYIPEGTSITIRATVTLDKDFGAGYRYDLILEDGVVVK